MIDFQPVLSLVEIYGQRIEVGDIAIIGVLIILEGVLSIDNALVLGLLAKRLPKHQQSRALTYGLVGAFVFRLICIFTASLLLKLPIVKLLGGGYLVYVSVKHFFFEHKDASHENVQIGPDGEPILVDETTKEPIAEHEREQEISARTPIPTAVDVSAPVRPQQFAAFWPTVFVIELTDIAFAIDSILAAIAFIPPSDVTPNPKLWVVVAGGMLGVILMRVAAMIFIKLLEKFPRFEVAAYLLVIVIGGKLIVDWAANSPEHHRVDFHSPASPAFWVFWLLMAICFGIGFIRKKPNAQAAAVTAGEPPTNPS